MSGNKREKIITTGIYIFAWMLLFAFPLIFWDRNSEQTFTFKKYLLGCMVPVSLIIVYYCNTLLLIPRILFRNRLIPFALSNILLVVLLCTAMNLWQTKVAIPEMKRETKDLYLREAPHRPDGPDGPQDMQGNMHDRERRHKMPKRIFFLRDALSLFFMIALACTVKMAQRYSSTEKSLREAEEERTKSELKNLKNQLNPHFLLNTLNNIYALIAIDGEKAQEAVHQLSGLLRHMLYENDTRFVPVGKEIDFLENYISLMKIRLSSNCNVDFKVDLPEGSNACIAPLLLISLIENAFKHGVSPTGKSFISIDISEQGNGTKPIICCRIENSWHPKNSSDKSGSGVGLKQVQKRLDILYKGNYKWKKGVEECEDGSKKYVSSLELGIIKQ